jgi:hypothetical protein
MLMETHMQARITARPVQDVISAIQALDLESVKVRAMDPELGEGWTREYADSIETAYRTYLTMLVKYPDHAEDILLSKDVDEFWHTHILQTMKYADDCEAVFGQFLHHSPHIGEVTPADHEHRARQAEKTRNLYEKEFGSALGAGAAWSGADELVATRNAAMSAVSIGAENAAMSAVSIGADRAAMSAVSIGAATAAMSAVSIRAGKAAMSAVSVRPDRAAMSAVSIRADKAAMSAVSIGADRAAMSAVSIRADKAAMSAVSIRPDRAAMSAVSIRPASQPAASRSVPA